MPVKSWKREQVLGTREWLIETAGRLFGEQGYAGTALEGVVAEAGLTRGALYHHFADKRALFDAVVDRQLRDLVEAVERRSVKRGLERGGERDADAIELFLEALCDGPTRQILLVDGPASLGRARWSELMGARLLESLGRPARRAAEAGRLEPQLVVPVTHLLLGAVQEAALLIGQRRDDTSGAMIPRTQVDRSVAWMLERLFGTEDTA